MDNGLRIPADLFERMRSHVKRQFPLEACGLLGGRGREVRLVIPVENSAGSRVRYRMDPAGQLKAFEQIESSGNEILAIFHSHPHGPSTPSPTDIAEAAYPVVHLIWSPLGGQWQARGFWIENGRAAGVFFVVADV